MSTPVIADNKPKKVSLEKGIKYAFCVCGRSSDQPFCDGSHDLATWHREMALLSGVRYAGVMEPSNG
jgi:CDGSH-type Zn-finger protein